MVTDCKLYECDICCRKETVEEGYEPNDMVPFEVYNLKPCICKKCLKIAVDAFNVDKIKEIEKKEGKNE